MMRGYLRADGGRGIRNHLLVVYLVECAHHVAREIAEPFLDEGVQVVGFPNCYQCSHAEHLLSSVCTHPNVGAALLVSLGCEGFGRRRLAQAIQDTSRPVQSLVIQQSGGTQRSIESGRQWVRQTLASIAAGRSAPLGLDNLTIGVAPSLSGDAISLAEVAAIAPLVDALIRGGARIVLAHVLPSWLGDQLVQRANGDDLKRALAAARDKARRHHSAFGSLAAVGERGPATLVMAPVAGLLKPGDVPTASGLYLLDSVPDGEPRFGHFDFNRSVSMIEAVACGAHLLLDVSGDGSITGSAVAPVVRICTDEAMYRSMPDDIDLDAADADSQPEIQTFVDAALALIGRTVDGAPTAAERLGHCEFTLIYKAFASDRAGCAPVTAPR